MKALQKGDFVTVGKDVGVVVTLENEDYTPEEHLGIWYGEKTEQGAPKYRTVPTAYCVRVTESEAYH